MKTQHGGKRYGIFSGALWGLDTVVLAIALAMTPFLDFGQSALAGAVLLVYMAVRGRLKDTMTALRTRPGKSVIVAALLGGPIGMSGYLIAIDNIGPGLTAIISTFYPALGTLLAFILLKERMAPRQIAALLVALAAIVATGWSATSEPIEGGNAILGVLGALACVIGWGSEAVILTWGMRDAAVDNEVALQIRETTSAVVYLFIVAPIRSLRLHAAFAGSPVGRRRGAGGPGGHGLVPLLLQGVVGDRRVARHGPKHLVLGVGDHLRSRPAGHGAHGHPGVVLRRDPRGYGPGGDPLVG